LVEKPYQWGEGATLEEHSKRKHKILREYFRRYLRERCKNPISRRFRLAIVDGFAGGGRYQDGSPGSPVIFAETLLSAVSKINEERAAENWPLVDVDCLMILNDNDPDAIQGLREAMAPFVAASNEQEAHVALTVEFHQGVFEAMVEGFGARIDAGRYRNVIYNLDQCGHSHVRRETIARVIRSEKSVEVFLTYAVQSLIAFLSKNEPRAVERRLEYLSLRPGALEFTEDLMSKNEWLGTAERIVFDHFGESAPFVTPFSINNPDGWRYWFMHFASSYRARQVYNDVLHENSSQQAHFGRAGLRMLSFDPSHGSGTLYLFDTDARHAAREQLPDDIARLISEGGDTIGISEFYRSIYNETPAHSDDIHSAIFDNPDLEVLTPKGNERRHPHTISLDDTLCLRKQMSFSLPKLGGPSGK
jgi:three-Cys-motif partner protein